MINKLKLILNNCWNIDTCYPKFKNIWSEKNKCLGQCAVTSLIVNDYLGGEIRKCYVGDTSHYFNFINNEIIDLTNEQFCTNNINYNNYITKSRKQILDNDNTRVRYEILNKRVLEYVKKMDSV
jgi:hypothetical protein